MYRFFFVLGAAFALGTVGDAFSGEGRLSTSDQHGLHSALIWDARGRRIEILPPRATTADGAVEVAVVPGPCNVTPTTARLHYLLQGTGALAASAANGRSTRDSIHRGRPCGWRSNCGSINLPRWTSASPSAIALRASSPWRW